MKRAMWMVLALVLAATALAMSWPQPPDESEQPLPVAAVPQHVLDAALAAFPGLAVTEAEVEAVLVYELEGTLDGRTVEVEVTGEGEVIGVEDEGAPDDDEAGGADDDDGDG